MNRSISQRTVAGMPIWAIAILGLTAFSVVTLITMLAVVSARAAGGRSSAGATSTSAPAVVYNPGLQLAQQAVEPGGQVLVTGVGWPSGDTVVIGLNLVDSNATPTIELGSVVTAGMPDSNGLFTAAFDFPRDARWANQMAVLVVGRSTQDPELIRWSRIELRQPTATPLPATGAPTAVPATSTAQPAASCTDKIQFVTDVTIPDLTVLQAGKSFDKVWRLRNSGTCTWSTDYALIFVDGTAMGGPATQALVGSVAPGSTVDVKVNLTAPASNGTYTGNWMLRNSAGKRFGIGSGADKPFWVKIQVGGTAVATSTGGAGGPTSGTGTWKGEYFNSMELKGTPVLTRYDTAINFDWKRGSPASAVRVDNFSVRWTRTLDFEAGVYRFKASVDDGMRLYIDGILVIDSWKDGSVRDLTTEVGLAKGSHTIKMEYYEHTREAVAKLSWSKVSTPTFSEWKGEYFSNRDLKGTPVLVRNDRTVDFSWKKGAPAVGLPADDFSVRWTRKMSFDDGTYRIRVTSDDGVRVYVDGKLVINEWRDQGGRSYSVDLKLSGKKTIVIEYYERSQDALIRFSIERQLPATATPTPTTAASPTPTATASPTATVAPTVSPPTETPTVEAPAAILAYQFADNLCQAEWSNANEGVTCPGDPEEGKGFALKTDQVALENGINPTSPSILLRPELVNFGVIRGIYPSMTVQTGDRFQAVVGCPSGKPSCNVIFALGYRVGDGSTANLGTWAQTLDGTVQTVDVGLQALAGQQVSFVLTLFAEQASNQNAAYWVNPRIVR